MNNNYLLTKIARLYYEEGYTQQEIALKLAISRPQISKLLKRARESGIVKIEIIDEERFGVLEIELAEKYSLKEVIVVPSHSDVKTQLALGGSEYFRRVVRNGLVVSLSWGSTLRKFVDIIDLQKTYNIEIVPLMGGMGTVGNKITSSEIARTLAEKIGGIHYVIHAPVVVKDKKTKSALMEEEVIKEIFEKAKTSNFSFVGIGRLTDRSTMVQEGYIEKSDFLELKENNIIGDICTTFFDENGDVVQTELNDRIIGIDIRDLKGKSTIVGIAGGEYKKEAILGALRGGFLDVLITDKEVALFLKSV